MPKQDVFDGNLILCIAAIKIELIKTVAWIIFNLCFLVTWTTLELSPDLSKENGNNYADSQDGHLNSKLAMEEAYMIVIFICCTRLLMGLKTFVVWKAMLQMSESGQRHLPLVGIRYLNITFYILAFITWVYTLMEFFTTRGVQCMAVGMTVLWVGILYQLVWVGELIAHCNFIAATVTVIKV